ncbi:hypothetical protein ABB55_00625 [Prosthecomicrobium hirschii]|uniref:Uncharacterized protein n=1 Tax=Prosthecodimorpha hirschii TaxID=665126 RepID=A0A0P6VYY4_9HYPH|nr:hypothetical protein [Prosthecomicrobium hirschii]KPL50911.1 hypothetical protein ABB55_00625 [Prosthecomicrobium hirschii]
MSAPSRSAAIRFELRPIREAPEHLVNLGLDLRAIIEVARQSSGQHRKLVSDQPHQTIDDFHRVIHRDQLAITFGNPEFYLTGARFFQARFGLSVFVWLARPSSFRDQIADTLTQIILSAVGPDRYVTRRVKPDHSRINADKIGEFSSRDVFREAVFRH